MEIKVRKRDHAGRLVLEYSGVVLEKTGSFVRLEAFFGRNDMPFQDVVLKKGDRFVETFYSDRWYNVFEIFDRDDGAFKGFYCNVGRPMVWDAPDAISYEDLALDYWVSAAGLKVFLDWDEYAALRLDASTRQQVRAALYALAARFD
jgi:predicted RNA-binding protein associated with RNAse of E/G family